jgi:hypothetical protein
VCVHIPWRDCFGPLSSPSALAGGTERTLLAGSPDLKVRVAPVHVAPARRVGAAVVRVALHAGAQGAGRTVGVPDIEVTIDAKGWPAGWAGVLVVGVTPGGFVALGVARAQPVEVVAAGGAVPAEAAVAVIPLDSAAAVLAPALLRLPRTHPDRAAPKRTRRGQGHVSAHNSRINVQMIVPFFVQ